MWLCILSWVSSVIVFLKSHANVVPKGGSNTPTPILSLSAGFPDSLYLPSPLWPSRLVPLCLGSTSYSLPKCVLWYVIYMKCLFALLNIVYHCSFLVGVFCYIRYLQFYILSI